MHGKGADSSCGKQGRSGESPKVPTVEGMALAQIWGCSFVESSAKAKINVNEVFAEIVREMNMKHTSKDREIVCTCCILS
jgi:Ras-related protein Rap-2C